MKRNLRQLGLREDCAQELILELRPLDRESGELRKQRKEKGKVAGNGGKVHGMIKWSPIHLEQRVSPRVLFLGVWG